MAQPYTIGHTGSVLEDAGQNAVWRSNNQTSPQRESEILELRCPTNFDQISFVGPRDAVRFEPRTHETVTVTSGNSTLSGITANLQPIAGEPLLEDQPFRTVRIYSQANSQEETDRIESVDYAANEITLSSNVGQNTTFDVYPVINEGTLKIRGLNALDQTSGPMYPWSFPIYRWADMEQNKRGTEVNLNGSITWQRDESIQILVDSPREVVWDHPNYPEAYVSTFEMDCRIEH
jgi:hypothetical protein